MLSKDGSHRMWLPAVIHSYLFNVIVSVSALSVTLSLKLSSIFPIEYLMVSESISNIHGSYFGLIDTRWLYTAELAVPLVVLWCWAKALATASGRSTIALGHLACAHDVLFTVVLVWAMRTLPLHLLLHGNRQLTIGPSTLCMSTLLG